MVSGCPLGKSSNARLPHHTTDLTHPHAELARQPPGVREWAALGQAEQEFVVLAACRDQPLRVQTQLSASPFEASRCGQTVELDLGPQRRLRRARQQQLREITCQSVGQIETRANLAGTCEGQPRLDAGHRDTTKRSTRLIGTQTSQRRSAQFACHKKPISDSKPATAECAAPIHAADDGDREAATFRSRKIATDKRAVEATRLVEKTAMIPSNTESDISGGAARLKSAPTGVAPIAARSERFTAKAARPMRRGDSRPNRK